eukprot:CAMPEP_0170546092 /NCGR_PEP_ID=MMETSP0211-20121228/4451_1 /TAXON_ID=311385 /ORGANISM="Pseudokeronopsis sp., Strain OXSARD2" /LENGTH=69 /DNA_ID=CAMNT_0010850361 /DNA_START=168 /DNA_END=377 /DNA_ORIENTATION=+
METLRKSSHSNSYQNEGSTNNKYQNERESFKEMTYLSHFNYLPEEESLNENSMFNYIGYEEKALQESFF